METHVIQTDVVVAGGGTAGCAAAISAARMGSKVILIEKMVVLGGLATAGNVLIYLPLCDGYGKQIIHGISEEMMLASIKYGPGEIPKYWTESTASTTATEASGSRYMLRFNPASLVITLDEMVSDAGVDSWFDTVVTDVCVEDGAMKAIECYNKSGHHRIEAKCFIDATGDADLAVLGNCAYNTGVNVLSVWTQDVVPDKSDLVLNASWPWLDRSETMTGISGKLVSHYALRSREMLLNYYKDKWKNPNLDRTNYYPAVLPTMMDFRRTRAIEGMTAMDDSNSWVQFDDSVGVFPASFTSDRSLLWSIPFGSMVPKSLDRLIVAGRCIDSRGDCWNHVRLIPVTAQTGDIAGLAANQCVQTGKSVHDLCINTLQNELASQGHPLSFEELYGREWKSVAAERIAFEKAKSS